MNTPVNAATNPAESKTRVNRTHKSNVRRRRVLSRILLEPCSSFPAPAGAARTLHSSRILITSAQQATAVSSVALSRLTPSLIFTSLQYSSLHFKSSPQDFTSILHFFDDNSSILASPCERERERTNDRSPSPILIQ
ncbi:hypothetical protein M8J77_019116 [Diaphorina citri]|nr:hypothetical protein M8J77_019116 [Diaphorina citri]